MAFTRLVGRYEDSASVLGVFVFSVVSSKMFVDVSGTKAYKFLIDS